MGIKSLTDPERYGLTLVLGGGEVSPLEMTSAYAVFANEGVRVQEHGILKVENSLGGSIYDFRLDPKQALDKETARQITDILSDNEARAPSYGYTSPLHFKGYDVAAKTGTTNYYKDAWIVGYTPRIAVGAWVGNNDSTPMEKKVAGFIVAPMWNAFMQEIIKSSPIQRFNPPYSEINKDMKPVLRGKWQGGESYFIDSRNGQIANSSTPDEYLKEEMIPNVHSILYWVNKDEPLGPKPESPEKDSQFYLWEYPIQKWVSDNNINLTLQNSLLKKTPVETVIKEPEKIKPITASLVSPDQRTKYFSDSKVTISIVTTGSSAPIKVEFYVNGQFVGSAMNAPFSLSFVPKEISLLQKYNNVRVVVYGPNGEKAQTSGSFTVEF
jgi:membrane carboxypeptidase/penicillin-binding protein PbpC